MSDLDLLLFTILAVWAGEEFILRHRIHIRDKQVERLRRVVEQSITTSGRLFLLLGQLQASPVAKPEDTGNASEG